jgi:hypothetical protein
MKRIAIPFDSKTEAQVKSIAQAENVSFSAAARALLLKGLQHHLAEAVSSKEPL